MVALSRIFHLGKILIERCTQYAEAKKEHISDQPTSTLSFNSSGSPRELDFDSSNLPVMSSYAEPCTKAKTAVQVLVLVLRVCYRAY